MDLDFKVKKYLQDSKLYNYSNNSSKLKINGELDTLELIDDKFNDLCSTYEKQFDQILTNSKSNNQESKNQFSNKSSKSVLRSKNNLEKQTSIVLNRSSSLKRQLSGIVQVSSNGAKEEIQNSQNSTQNQNDKLAKQKSILLNKQGSLLIQQSSPNFLIRHNNQDLSKQASMISQNNSEPESNLPVKIPNKLNLTNREKIVNNLNIRPQTVLNKGSDLYVPSNSINVALTSKQSSYARRQFDHINNKTDIVTSNLKRSLSRNQSNVLDSPRKKSNSPSQTASYGQSQPQQKNQDHHNKTVKFATPQSPKIRSLKNIEEIQDNLVKIGIGSMMVEQLRLSQMDLNKVDDIDSFKDRQTLLSSKYFYFKAK